MPTAKQILTKSEIQLLESLGISPNSDILSQEVC